jgi:alpha-N-arabinofuranosidase
VSGYDWQDGIGERDRRPPRKNPAWKGIESNDVGLHEFMALVREIGAEPYVAVNTGLAGASSSAGLVQYANGAATTPQGRRRAENGSPSPFEIKFWAIGNEMYGDWQLGHIPREVRREAPPGRTRCGRGPVDRAGGGGRARRVEPDDAWTRAAT